MIYENEDHYHTLVCVCVGVYVSVFIIVITKQYFWFHACVGGIIFQRQSSSASRISLSLSHYLSLSPIIPGSFSKLHPVTIQSWCKFFFWSDNTSVSMCRSPEDNIAYDFVFTSPTVPYMSCLSYLDDLWDGR